MQCEELIERILSPLNEKQKQAVTAPSSGALQIVAGPGTGKTTVIVSRVAYLLLHEKIKPEEIIVTTFTKKAAIEMTDRLRELLVGTDITVLRLLIGTFHSICYRIISKYGHLIQLQGFSIADEKDSQQIFADVISNKISDDEWNCITALPDQLTAPFKSQQDTDKNRGFDTKKCRRQISKLKAAGIFADAYESQSKNNRFLAIIYRNYQAHMQASKLLDFDDCLMYCYRIISKFPVLNYIKHTLVDEFQDTNEIQLRLMYEFAKDHSLNGHSPSNVTIVGDPDQSIYAFRDAQSLNFEMMRQHYLNTESIKCNIIMLDENYRSTSDILTISESVMRQQSGRVLKNLRSQMSASFRPFSSVLSSADEEARWLAHQIEFLMGLPQNVFAYSDIAILVRTAFQTRVIENELTRKKIPYLMVRGKAFWERKEVIAIVDYLRCVANDNDKLALLRCVNFPKRGLGSKTVTELSSVIDSQILMRKNVSVFQILREIGQSKISCSLGPKMKTNLTEFVQIISQLKTILNEELHEQSFEKHKVKHGFFDFLLKSSGLEEEYKENVDSQFNINEVKSQFLAFEASEELNLPDISNDIPPFELEIEFGQEHLKKFLESISLYDLDPTASGDKEMKTRVAISTIHGAKGLEWPVVFVPGISEGLLPASFALDESNPESINEERRCFYVATSRAKILLYLSAYTEPQNGGKWGRKPIEKPSRFLKTITHCCSPSLEIRSSESLQKLLSLARLEESVPNFNMDAYYNEYEKKLAIYVKEEASDDQITSGFTTAGQLRETYGYNFTARRSFSKPRPLTVTKPCFSHKPSLGCNLSSESEGKKLTNKKYKKAFISPFQKVNTPQPIARPTTIDAERKVTQTSSIKRAPAYIPTRTGNKRRLGTK